MSTPAPVRASFLLRVRPDRIDAYVDDHRHVWAAMRDALARAGWSNYSLFLDRRSGLVVGYVETDDFDLAQSRMAEESINAEWQAAMAGHFAAVDASVEPGELVRLDEYFHLD